MPTQLPRRARRLKNLKISEVSSVDRGAGETCTVVLSKRDDGTQAAIEKGFNALHESIASIIDDDGLVDKSEALAMTMEQAHDYFQSFGVDIGKADDDDIIEFEKGYDPMSAYDALMQKAVALQKAEPKLSRHQAFAKCYADPANKHLADADRVQRRSRHVQKAADDRLVERAAELRKANPHISMDDAIDRVRKRNPELVEAWRKGRTNVDPVGRGQLPDQDNALPDQTWAPRNGGRRQAPDAINSGANRVFDGSSTAQSPAFYGTDRDTIQPSGGDIDGSELLQLWRAWSKQLPGLTPDDVARMVSWQSPTMIASKRLNGATVVDRVTARAAAMVKQHPEMSQADAVANILGRDKTLASAYQREIEES
jgi:hypothetical protein